MLSSFAFRVVLLLAVTLVLLGCRGEDNHAADQNLAIVPSRSAVDERVTEGQAYDRGSLDVSSVESITVPHDAEIRPISTSSRIEVYLEKDLSFAGHPPYPMHIREARHYMGLAYRIRNGNLVLATYGEWDSHIEGGAHMRVRVDIPKRLQVRRSTNLSGDGSEANAQEKNFDAAELKQCYWYGARKPGVGWEVIVTKPDTTMTLR